MSKLCLIAAISSNHCIGDQGKLPWHIPDDLTHFKMLTTGYPVVMGRKTFQSIGRPLPKRHNIVITRDMTFNAEGILVANTIWGGISAAQMFSRMMKLDKVFIIGGGEIYTAAMDYAKQLYITHVHKPVSGDAFFPIIDKSVWNESSRSQTMTGPDGIEYHYATYDRI